MLEAMFAEGCVVAVVRVGQLESTLAGEARQIMSHDWRASVKPGQPDTN
jgi:hypothetical protein